MNDKIYDLDEMRQMNIITYEYQQMDVPGIVEGTLDMKARCRDKYQLRVFFTLSDGRKIITPVFWWQQYAGMYEIPIGTKLRLTYVHGKDGKCILKSAEAI